MKKAAVIVLIFVAAQIAQAKIEYSPLQFCAKEQINPNQCDQVITYLVNQGVLSYDPLNQQLVVKNENALDQLRKGGRVDGLGASWSTICWGPQ